MAADVEPAVTKVVAIVGDGGGTAEALLRALPERPGFALIVACSKVSNIKTSLPVTEVRDHVRLERDRVFVVPPSREVRVDGKNLVVIGAADETACDRMLRSIADSFQRDAAAVLLDGRGQECVVGLKRIRESGGFTICEAVATPATRAATAAGIVDAIVTRDEIPRLLAAFGNADDDAAKLDAAERRDSEALLENLREVISMLRVRTGHDFSAYKRATLYRRIMRRMQVCQTETIAEYRNFLREHTSELANLLRDLLISVTNFFRDSVAFEALEHTVIPKLFAGKQPSDQVRVWCAGCATGEEAYTLAMLLVEHASHVAEPPQLQVFATDIDEDALAEARAGIYPLGISADVSAPRLARFFTRENDRYRVTKELRELVLFSPHNLLRDPPFSRLDLVTCRNLLIYLNRDAQDRVLSLFHFGLRPNGFLLLGSSESADNLSLQFQPIDAAQRIYGRRMVQSSVALETLVRWPAPSIAPPAPPPIERGVMTFGQLHHRIVEQLAPPSVLVNEELDVVHLSEHAGEFLMLAGGEPTRQLLRLVHAGLRIELRSAIYAARQEPQRGDRRIVRFDDERGPRSIELRVRAVESPQAGRGMLLVIFDEITVPSEPAERADVGIEPVVRELEDELNRTRDQLRATIEQYETSVEELKASNEELHAINEELRSTTEELETSKEELQSVNEELTTLNHELKVKIAEVSRANSDLQNLMTSTDIGVVFLDRNLHIKRFTPRAQDIFHVIPADIGRPLAHVTHQLEVEVDDLSASAHAVLRDLRPIERQLRTRDGRRFLARMLPYRSLDDRIEGVVLTFVDVTHEQEALEARVRSDGALRTAEDRLRVALQGAPIAIMALDAELAPVWAYVHGRELETPRRVLAEMFAPGHADRFLMLAGDVRDTGSGTRGELELIVGGTPRTYGFRIDVSRSGGINAVGFDITPSKIAELALHDADRRKDEFLATLSHELRNPLTPLRVAFDVARLGRTDAKQLDTALAIMGRQLDVLLRLVDDLLELSRITQGKLELELEEIDPLRVVELALETVRPLVDAAHQTLQASLPDGQHFVRGDLTRLAQAVTNLLTNATRYTPDGGTIWVDVTVDLLAGSARIAVRDNGSGIDPELLPQIFEMYFQSRDELGRSRRGLGVGLNLVKRIVDLHGGTITAASSGNGSGSEFVIELPLLRGPL